MQVQTVTPWEWAFQHLQLIGWPAIVLVAWKASSLLTKASSLIADIETRAVAVENDIKEMKNNHLNHIEMSLEGIGQGIEGMRDDMRTYWMGHNKR